MTAPWHVHHVYYTDLDRLVAEVEQVFADLGDRLSRAFWERHIGGGPHLRVHVAPTAHAPGAADAVAERLRAFVAAHPSTPLTTYNPESAARLLAFEADDASDVAYRVNVVETHPYRRSKSTFESDGAVALLESFYEATGPLVLRILHDDTPRRETLFRIFLLTCLQMNGAYPRGAVAFKSHWQGVAYSDQGASLAGVIRQTYQAQRIGLHDHLPAVRRAFDEGLSDAPLLAEWARITDACVAQARTLKQTGRPVLSSGSPTDGWFQTREAVMTADTPSPFLQELFENPALIERMLADPHAQDCRLRVNLLYLFVAHLGLRPVDRFAMGYFTFRSVEDVYGVDLLDVFREQKARLLNAPTA